MSAPLIILKTIFNLLLLFYIDFFDSGQLSIFNIFVF
jgi:hypothetical protein